MVRRRRTRPLAVVAVALAVLVLVPGVALAHASFDVRQLPAASTQELVLRVPLERDAANDLVEVLVPGTFTVDTCAGAEGWSCRQDTTADGDTVLTLERAPDGPGDTERFTMTVTAPAEEGVYAFPTIQTYDDGEEAAWIGDPGSDRPAPRLQVGDETAPVEFSGDATPHTELADDEPAAAPTPTPDAEASPNATPSEAVTAEPTVAATAAPDDDTGDDAGGVAVSGAVLAIAAAIVLAAVVVAVVAVVLLRRRQ